ncbi:MAG: putative DNA binding domain-containing protein [bacterium]|nr:putative DNA binding domain-containing protein [bacterium]
MQYPIIIKRSPLALVKNIVAVELLAGFALFASTFLTNYERIYYSVFANFIRFDYLEIITVSFLQIIITLIVFLRWHNENYEIREKEIISRKGIFNITQTSLPINNIKSIIFRQDLLEKLTSCGTVIIKEESSKNIFMRNIENADKISEAIRGIIEKDKILTEKETKKLSIADLISQGESQYLEFKQGLRWDQKQQAINKGLEKSAMKSIASFLNADGGKFIIGVADDKTIYGLEDDYKTLPRQDRDGFENHFNHIFQSMLSPRFRQFVKINFERINGRDICLIEVRPSDQQVYLKQNNAEEFYIRTGNTTSALTMSEAQDYIKSHWR